MSLLVWILFGALAGWIASMITDRNEKQGLMGNIVVGIIGAFGGGFIVSLLGGDGITGFNIYSLLVAIGGAVLVLYIWKQIASNS